MLFRQKELLRWLGVSIFEIWVWLVSLTVFSVLLVLKIEVGLTIVTYINGHRFYNIRSRLRLMTNLGLPPPRLHLLVPRVRAPLHL